MLVEGMQQCCSLQLSAASGHAELQRMRTGCNGVFIAMHDEPCSDLFCEAVAELDHFLKLVSRIDVEERKRKRTWIERFAGKVNEHARVLADGIKQHRVAKLRNGFAQYVNGFAF